MLLKALSKSWDFSWAVFILPPLTSFTRHDSVEGKDREKVHSFQSTKSGLVLYYCLFYDSVTKPVSVVKPGSVLAMEIITTALTDVLLMLLYRCLMSHDTMEINLSLL